MQWRLILLTGIVGPAALYAVASYGGPSGVSPHVQSGRLLLINGVGMRHPLGFIFQPDGKSAEQNASPTGTRSMAWQGSAWAICDSTGNSCRWQVGDQAPRCVRVGARVQLAWVDVLPAGGWGGQAITWLKCLRA